jgi:very-short-patch-repair endonuclease
MDLSGPFRGSLAVSSGSLSRGRLAGPRFRRLFPDIYVPAGLEATLAVRAGAAWLLVEPDGAVSGWSAAELLGASSGPKEAPAEVTVPRFRRPLPGLRIHRESLVPDELTRRCGMTLTTPTRTAYDLLRWLDLTEGVAALDALAHTYPFTADDVRALRSRHLGLPGNPSVEAGLRLMDRRAESPMESRIRVALVQAGLPPHVQHPVTVGGRDFRLDLAYPDAMLAVEYDGGHHRTAARALKDLEREGLLTAAGWKIIRFDAATVLHVPARLVTRTRALITTRTRRHLTP